VALTGALGRDDGLHVTTHDNRTLDAELAGWDPASGLAVLRAANLNLSPPPRDDARPRIGHLAFAVGRSWSNALTASVGIVAVIGGPLRTGRGRAIDEVIRTTAPMHDGFAGGAFVNTAGAVIGVTTAASIRGLGDRLEDRARRAAARKPEARLPGHRRTAGEARRAARR
jgi:S1-C subfamily serine protease